MNDRIVKRILVEQIHRCPCSDQYLKTFVLDEGNKRNPDGFSEFDLLLVDCIRHPIIAEELLIDVFVANLQLHVVDLVVRVFLDLAL